MKNLLFPLVLLCYIMMSSFSFYKPFEPNSETKNKTNTFNEFRVHRNGQDKMACVWSFASETGVVRYEVLKTYNEPTDPYAMWEIVSSVLPNGSRSYKIIDSPVYPGYISYKINAISANGTSITSNIITEKINAKH